MADGFIGRIDGVTGDVSVEAEDIIEAGFTVETHGVASGGHTVSLLDTGNTAGILAYDFEGATGTYNLSITVHDEFDGESALSVWVNGVRLRDFTLDQATPRGVVTDANRVALTLDGLALETGDRVEIRATQDEEEWVRIDRLDFGSSAISPPPPPPPPLPEIGLGETQAEALDLSGGFEIERRGDADQGALVRTFDAPGEAEGRFTGPAGRYQIEVTYFEENDGRADFSVLVNGEVVDHWLGTRGTDALGTPTTQTLHADLKPGDVITLRGEKGGEALARIDALNVTLLSADNTAPIVRHPIADQAGAEGEAFAFTLPANTFFDADGDVLSLSADLDNGGDLPDWLDFDAVFGRFFGTPQDGDGGTLAIAVTASDGAASVSDTFDLVIDETIDALATLQVGLNEAEALSLDGFEIETRQDASDGALVRTFGEGTAAGVFDGPSGRYRLDLGYQEESDGTAKFWVFVNDVEVLGFRAERGSEALGSGASASVEIDLEVGDVVTVRGAREREALARVDTVTLTAVDTGGNTDPIAENDTATTAEDMAVTLAVLANDRDEEGDTLVVTNVSGAVNGAALLNPDGSVTFTPNADFNGEAGFTYQISDGEGGTGTGDATITVTPVNDAPVARTDSLSVDEDGAANGVLQADDVDGETLSFALADGGAPANGTVEIDPDGVFLYEPAPDFVGTDAFTYTVSDGTETVTQTVTVTVGATNDAPVAQDDSATTDEDAAVTIPVLANDSDADGDSLSIATATEPANGAVTINPNGTITYTPDANFNGTDTFDYTVTDGDLTDTATVTVTANPVADPAVITGVSTGAVTEDSVLEATGALLVDDPDAGEAAFIAQAGTAGTFGTFSLTASGNWTYSLNNTAANVQALNTGDTETDTFTATTVDGTTQTITLTINGVDEGATGIAPVANDVDFGTIERGTDLTIETFDIVSELASDSDSDLAAADIVFTDATVDGLAVSFAVIGFTYTPGAGDEAQLTVFTEALDPDGPLALALADDTAELILSFTATDSSGLSDTGTVTVTLVPDDGFSNVFDPAALGGDGVNLLVEFASSDPNATAVANVTSAADGPVEAEAAFVGNTSLRTFFAGFADDVFEAPANNPDQISLATAEAENASTATATASDGSATVAAASENSTAVATASKDSTANTAATVNSTANATASGDSDVVATAATNSESSATADGGSDAVSIVSENSTATADASDNSEASATAINTSTSAATATAQSGATAVAIDNSTATAESDEASSTAATSSDGSTTIAAASENSTAVATASEESFANAAANVGSTANATASNDGDSLATSVTDSESSATATNGGVAASISSNGSSATASASDGSDANATADIRSTSAATATVQSDATAIAVDNSDATAESDQASSTAATASKGSEAVATANDENTAVATSRDVSGVAGQPIDLTGLIDVDADGLAGEVQGITISGLPVGSEIAGETADADSTVTLSGALPDTLTLTVPASFEGSFELTLRALLPPDAEPNSKIAEAIATQTVTIFASSGGTNVAPIVSAIDGGTIGEGDAAIVLDLLDPDVVSDPDGDTLSAEILSVTDDTGAAVGAIFDGRSLTLDPFQFRFLDQGESRSVTVRYDVSDSEASVENIATLVITGADDQAVIIPTDALDDTIPVFNEIAYQASTSAFFATPPTVTGVAGGGFVVAWMGSDGDGTGIFAQVFDRFGDAFGPEILVNPNTENSPLDPHVEPLPFGGFAVAWDQGVTGDEDVAARLFDAKGVPLSGELRYENEFSGGNNFFDIEYLSTGGIAIVLPVREGQSQFSVTDVRLNGINSFGTEFGGFFRDSPLVNNERFGDQRGGVVSDLGNSTFVVVWVSNPGSGQSIEENEGIFGVKARIFSDAFDPIGEEFQVTELPRQFGIDAVLDVATLSDGDFVITWAGVTPLDGSEAGILARRYAPDGMPRGEAFLVNQETLSDQDDPQIAALPNGGYAITFISNGLTGDDSGTSIQARVFDANDAPVTDEFRVNTDVLFSQRKPGIAGLEDGAFVVTWEDVGAFNAAIFEGDGTPRSQSGASANGVYTFSADLLTNNDVIEFDRDTSSTSIQARFFSENGAAAAREFRVNSEFNGFQTDPDITQLADGRIVIVWESPDLVDDPSETGVKAQIFEADGTPVGEEFLINTVFANSQSDPKVTALEDGGFLVVYTSTDRGEGELFSRIKAQLFEADGTRRGEEFNIDDFGGRTPGLTDVVTLEKGGFAALWQDTTPDDLGTEDVNESRTIYLLRFFGADGQPVGDAIEIDPDSPGAFQATAITKLEDGNVLVTWSDVTASDDDTFSREEARIVGRVYAPDGSVVAADFTASNAGDIINDGQSAAALGDGGFVVAWRAFTVVGDTTEARLAARIYGADNQPVGDEFVLTTLANVFFTDVQISATADGGFVATYRVDTGDDFLAPEYVAEFFNADGTSKGDPVPLHSQEVGFETSVRAVGLESGNVVFVWASDVEALNTEPLTIIDVSDNSALGAVVTLNEDGTVSYDATGVAEAQALAPGETLTDSFTYTAQNGSGGTDTASVTITVFGENAQPVAPPIDAGTVTEEDGDVLIDLLDGAFDPEGETVTAELIRVTSEFGIDVPFRLVDEDTIAIDPERYAALDDSESLTLTVDFQVSDGVHSVANTATLVIEGTDDELAAVNDRIEPTPEWVVNLATQSSQFDPRAIATDDGFVIAWESFDRTIDRDRLGLKAIVFEEDGSFNPSRGEFLVNRFTAGDQRNIDMAILNDGNILYVWETTTGSQGDTSSSAIKAIVRDGQGNFNLGDEFLVNEFTDGAQRAPSVALLPDGGYVIVWESAEPGQGDESRSGIKARLFDADGTPRTLPGSTVSEFLVNERTESFQESPNITLLADGRFVVVWAGRARLDEDVDGAPIIAGRIFNPDGTPASAGGSEFQISETEFLQTEFGDAETPDVEALPDGGFVVVWESTENRDAEIKARFYDSSGIPAGDAFVVNESGSGLQTQPSIDVLEDGGVVIVWRSEAIDRAEDPDGTSIRGRVFNADGTPRILPGEESAEFVVNIIAETDQSDPDVAALADGGFIVTWSSRDDEQTDKSFGGVKARVFNADGTTRDVGGAGETNFLRIPVDQILQNDFSGNTNLQITRVSGSELGAFVSLNTTSGEISYDPRNLDVVKALALGEVIEDRFTYTVTDSSLETDTATVTIVIRGSDDGNASASVVLMGAPTLLKDKPAAPEDMLEAAIQGDSLVLDAFQASEPLERAAPPIQEGHDDPLIETAASSALDQEWIDLSTWTIDHIEFEQSEISGL